MLLTRSIPDILYDINVSMISTQEVGYIYSERLLEVQEATRGYKVSDSTHEWKLSKSIHEEYLAYISTAAHQHGRFFSCVFLFVCVTASIGNDIRKYIEKYEKNVILSIDVNQSIGGTQHHHCICIKHLNAKSMQQRIIFFFYRYDNRHRNRHVGNLKKLGFGLYPILFHRYSNFKCCLSRGMNQPILLVIEQSLMKAVYSVQDISYIRM